MTTYGAWGGPLLITGADGVNPTVVDNGDGTFTITDGDGNAVTVSDGATGTAGTNGNTVDVIFRRDTTVPATPTPSTGVPAGWFATSDLVPSGTGLVYASFGIQTAGVGNFVWEAPVQVEGATGPAGTNGTNGTNGVDGVNGDRFIEVFLYQNAATSPTVPAISGSIDTTNGTAAATGLSLIHI